MGLTAAAVAAGVWTLLRRRAHWVGVLRDDIAVHKAFWRERRDGVGDVLYVALGDSAATGIGASAPDRGYVGTLAERIHSAIGGPVRVVNLGIAGAKVRHVLDSELPTFAKYTPDIVTVCIGANDMQDFEAARFEREIGELFAALPPHAIVGDLPSFHVLPGERRVRQANAIVRAVAAEHGLTVVSLYEATRRQGIRGIVTQFAGDLFHPNDAGYRVWADAFAGAVDARLAELASRA